MIVSRVSSRTFGSYNQVEAFAAMMRRSINEAAQWVSQRWNDRAVAEQKREELEITNPDFVRNWARNLVHALLLGALIVFLYPWDLMILRPLVDFATSSLFGSNPLFVWIGRYLPPALVIAIDVTIALKLASAVGLVDVPRPSPKARMAWRAASIGFLFAIGPLLFSALYNARLRASGLTSGPPELVAHTWTLCAITVIAHALLLFGGAQARSTKEYVMFSFRRWFFSRAVNAAAGDIASGTSQIADWFAQLTDLQKSAWTSFGHMMPLGPFRIEAAELLTELYPRFKNDVFGVEEEEPEPSSV